jgi:hypothetical protein
MTGAVGLGDRAGLGGRRRLVGLGDRGLGGRRHPVGLGDRALGDRRHPVDLGDRAKPWGTCAVKRALPVPIGRARFRDAQLWRRSSVRQPGVTPSAL